MVLRSAGGAPYLESLERREGGREGREEGASGGGGHFGLETALRAVVRQNVDFIGGSKKKLWTCNLSISDVRYAMKSPFTCDQVRLGPSSRRHCLHNFFAW